jgi:hypothetical protein
MSPFRNSDQKDFEGVCALHAHLTGVVQLTLGLSYLDAGLYAQQLLMEAAGGPAAPPPPQRDRDALAQRRASHL